MELRKEFIPKKSQFFPLRVEPHLKLTVTYPESIPILPKHRLLALFNVTSKLEVYFSTDYCDEPSKSPQELHKMAEHCNDKKTAAKRCSDLSSELFFAVFIKVILLYYHIIC